MAGRCGCASSCDCCATDSPTVGRSGSGSVGNCFQFGVRFSTDAGNIATAGTDGGVFAKPCILGPDGNPLTVNDDGCQVIPAPCILDYNGDPIPPNETGCIPLPPAAAPAFGCGLTTLEDGTLVAQTAELPGTDLSGTVLTLPPMEDDPAPGYGLVFCDGGGNLRTLPDHTIASDETTGTVYGPTIDDIAADTATSSVNVTLSNPSLVRNMRAAYVFTSYVDGISGVNSGLTIELQYRINLGAWTSINTLRFPEPSTGTIRSGLAMSQIRLDLLSPTDVNFVEARWVWHKVGVGVTPTAVEARIGLRALGWTI